MKFPTTFAVLAATVIAGLATNSAQAEVESNTRQTLELGIENPCTEEEIDLQGSLHTVTRRTENGNNVHLGIHMDFHGTGTGNKTGIEYVVNGTHNGKTNISDSDNYTATATTTETVVSKGPAPNFQLRVKVRFVKRDGEVRVDVIEVEERCLGRK